MQVRVVLIVTFCYLTAQVTLGHLHLPDLTRVMKVYQGVPYVYLVPLQGVEQGGASQVVALDLCPQFHLC